MLHARRINKIEVGGPSFAIGDPDECPLTLFLCAHTDLREQMGEDGTGFAMIQLSALEKAIKELPPELTVDILEDVRWAKERGLSDILYYCY